MKIEKKVLDMSLAGIFTAVIIAMSVVPFRGYIPLGFMNATIIHVPVIIGALLLGPKYGAYLGLVFGLTSLVRATLTPTVTSFVFSPFVTIGGYSGNMFHSADTRAKSCTVLSNDERWSLPCFMYPDYQIRLLRHFMFSKGRFLAVLFTFLVMNE